VPQAHRVLRPKSAALTSERCTGRQLGGLKRLIVLAQAQELDPDTVAEVLREHDAGRASDARLQDFANQDVQKVQARIKLLQLSPVVEQEQRAVAPAPPLV
jgi:hypothetical protein